MITAHGREDGAAGLILNHPTGRVVGDFLKESEFASLRNLAVHEGGPVMREQMTFFSFWWSRKLGLRWAMRISAKQAAEHARKPGRIVRAFIGYSGWTEGQLDEELKSNSWIVTSTKTENIFSDEPDKLWTEILKGRGKKFAILASFPENPSVN